MELKEIEAKIRSEHPDFAELIDSCPSQDQRETIWRFACSAYDLGFMRGMTHGLEQHAKVMDFALGKIFGKDPT